AVRASSGLTAEALCAPAAAVTITASNVETRMRLPRFMYRKLQRIEFANLDFIRFFSSCSLCRSQRHLNLPLVSLLRPGRNHAVAARVRDRLPQMLVLIFENQHQRALLRHVSSEQFHRRLQVVVGKS